MASVSLSDDYLSFRDGESELYNEVQRARRFNRELTLATVSVSGGFKGDDLERLAEKARREMVRRYLVSRVGKRLTEVASHGDLVVARDGGFVLVFPESSNDTVLELLGMVARDLEQDLGLRVQAGVAQFPSEECTLTGLIERAESEMDDLGELQQSQNS